MTKFNEIYKLLIEVYKSYINGNHLLRDTCIDLSSKIRQERYEKDWKLISDRRLAESIFQK